VLYAPYGAVARFEKVKARLLRRREKDILRLRKPTVEVRRGGREQLTSGRKEGREIDLKEEKLWIKFVLIHTLLPPLLPPSLPPPRSSGPSARPPTCPASWRA